MRKNSLQDARHRDPLDHHQERRRHPQGAARAQGARRAAAGEAQVRAPRGRQGRPPLAPRGRRGHAMNERLLEFSNLLRRNGLRVSLAENMDTFRALSVVGLGDRETVRATLRASMVKRTIDIPTFEQLFTLFFSGLTDGITQAPAATSQALGLDD